MISFPFDNTSAEVQDRSVNSDTFAEYLSRMIGTNGIFSDLGTKCQVVANESMKLTINPGDGIIEGRFFIENEPQSITLEAAESLDRIDTVVIRLDKSKRLVEYDIKKGTASSSPTRPTLTRNAGIYELGIADITVGKSVVGISQSKIKDTRLETSRCGVAPTFGNIDTNGIFAQYQAALDEFLEFVDDSLAQGVATTLQNQINELKEEIQPVNRGGTGATTAEQARKNLAITPANIGAAPSTHKHSAEDIKSGILPLNRGGTGNDLSKFIGQYILIMSDLESGISGISFLPIDMGGTGATNEAAARANLGLNDLIKIQSFTPENWLIKANAARGGEIEGTVRGLENYTPIVVSCYCTNSYNIVILNSWIDGQYSPSEFGFTWHIDARNLSDQDLTASFVLIVIWVSNKIIIA